MTVQRKTTPQRYKHTQTTKQQRRRRKEMIKELETLPENKMPPVAIYKKLVELTGLRNSWTVKEWINFLNKKGAKNV